MNSNFDDAVTEYLKPYAGNFNYAVMRQGHLDISRFHKYVKDILWYRPVLGSQVLSSGCGSAGDLFAFMEAGAARAYELEITDGVASLARLRFTGTRFAELVEIDVYDGFVIPYANDSFDIIMSMHVIEHTHNTIAYLAELFRVLKPGGIIFLDVPNRNFKIEQHTLLRYIHFLPIRVRDAWIQLLLSKAVSSIFPLSEERRYKLSTLVDYHFPSATQLVRIYDRQRVAFSLFLRDAFFHCYTEERVPYGHCPGKNFLGRARNMTTFRIVIEKT